MYFRVELKAVSSIHTQDEKLDDFLRLCHDVEARKMPAHMGEAKLEKELKDKIMDVCEARVEPLVKFLPLILDEMVKLIIRPPILINSSGKTSDLHKCQDSCTCSWLS